MNKEEYDKLPTYEKIDYDIQMDLYMKYNDRIASINDHLGEIYGYSDLKDMEDAEKQEELELYKKALKEKCDALDKAIDYIENNSHKTEFGDLEQDNESIDINDDVTETEFIEELLELLKGDSNE